MNCVHRQAEPVELVTGERVACICIGCLVGLPSDWIEYQFDKAHREAYCAHDEAIDVTQFGEPGRTVLCARCGRVESY
jgi:hypothetical protein